MKNMIGVIVGRFQVSKLTEGHKFLIKTVLSECSEVLILIGDTKDSRIDCHDPLPFESRRIMVEDYIKTITVPNQKTFVYRIQDVGDFFKWTKELDSLVDLLTKTRVFSEGLEITMYGSRDSFILGYKENNGKYQTKYIVSESSSTMSGTESRSQILNNGPIDSEDFRAGVIWGMCKRKQYDDREKNSD